jgi:hypothetical protein
MLFEHSGHELITRAVTTAATSMSKKNDPCSLIQISRKWSVAKLSAQLYSRSADNDL